MEATDEMSLLQKIRAQDLPDLPKILTNLSLLEPKELEKESLIPEIKESFPLTSNKRTVKFTTGSKRTHLFKRVGVLFSGGQASGGHNVIVGLFDALNKMNPESELIGFLSGPDGLIRNESIKLNKNLVHRYLNQGGFDLIGSGRTKIETEEQFRSVLETVKSLKLDAVVIIGGDDSNTNAAYLAEYFAKEKVDVDVVGIPKTIDGDLKNDDIEISFGFDSACKTYSEFISNIARDALSAKKYYYFVKLMGRSASHVTLECALQVHPNLALISEEIKEKKKTLEDVVSEISEVITERASQGKDYGLILIPEGVLEFVQGTDLISLLDDSDLQGSKELDPHGNLQVSKIETERFFIQLVKRELEKRKKNGTYKGKFNPQPIFCGYEGRSCFPSHFDSRYTYALGHVAALLIDAKLTGYMAFVQNLTKNVDDWTIGAVPLLKHMHLELRHGKMKPVIKKALVDLESDLFKMFKNLREEWVLMDDYRYVGPIQFFGPAELTDELTLTLKNQG